jgi:hypothetical protein
MATKAFAVVPAPNMGRPGFPLQAWNYGGPSGFSLNPGTGVMPNQAVNLRNLSKMYTAPDQTSRPNPAALIDELYDETKGFDRDLGQANIRIVGVSRDATGVALGTCVVKVFRTVDDVLVASTVSDGSGDWTAYPNQAGPYYFVEYKSGAPDVFGTSPNTNTATTFQPGG